MKINGVEYVSVSRASKILGFSGTHIRVMCKSGKLGYTQKGKNGWIMVCLEDIKTLLDVCKKTSNKS